MVRLEKWMTEVNDTTVIRYTSQCVFRIQAHRNSPFMLSAISGKKLRSSWKKLRSSWKKLRWQAPSDIDMIARHYMHKRGFPLHARHRSKVEAYSLDPVESLTL